MYARIIEGIRNQIDVPVYPSYPAYRPTATPRSPDAPARYAHIEALAERGLLEFVLVDPGTVNFTLTTTTSTASRPALT